MGMALPVGIGAAIAIAVGIGVALRRRKKASIRRTIQAGKQDEDIESVLDNRGRKDDRK